MVLTLKDLPIVLLFVDVIYCKRFKRDTLNLTDRQLRESSQLDKNMYIYGLDTQKSFLIDYGMYEGNQRSPGIFDYYLATRRRKGHGNEPWDEPWTLTQVTDMSGDKRVHGHINKWLDVPLNQDIESEVKLLRKYTVPTKYGDVTKYYSTDSTHSTNKRPPAPRSHSGPNDFPDCKILSITSDSPGDRFKMTVYRSWSYPKTEGYLKIKRNSLFGQYIHGNDPLANTLKSWASEVDAGDQNYYGKSSPEMHLPSLLGIRLHVKTYNDVGPCEPSVLCAFYVPDAPHIELIDLDKSNYGLRSELTDVTFLIRNPKIERYDDQFPEMRVFRNKFQMHTVNQQEKTMDPAKVPVKDISKFVYTFTFTRVPLLDDTSFKAKAFNVIGYSQHSNIINIYKPEPPNDLRVESITLDLSDFSRRTYRLVWENPRDHPLNHLLCNWLNVREKARPYTSTFMVPFSKTYSNTYRSELISGLPDKECELSMQVQNYAGTSSPSNIVTVDKPERPWNFLLKRIDKNADKPPTSDFHFDLNLVEYMNYPIEIILQYRASTDKGMSTWRPWSEVKSQKGYNNDPTEFIVSYSYSKRLMHSGLAVTDLPTDSYTAMQFRSVIKGYVDTSDPSEIVTIERPSRPEIRVIGIDTIPPRSEEEEEELEKNGLMPKKVFTFKINFNYNDKNRLNRITKVQFEYRVAKNLQGNKPRRPEDWRSSEPIDIPDLSFVGFREVELNLTLNFKKDDRPSATDFRAIAIGLIGTSDPSSENDVVVPAPPRELNYIYYGSDIECSNTKDCMMELDWLQAENDGSFRIHYYVIQKRKRSMGDYAQYWADVVSVPELGRHHMRQVISLDYQSAYRVVARSMLGDSPPSNVLFEKNFVPYHLKVSYKRDPGNRHGVIIYLEWDKMADKKVAYYIVQSTMFFKHDINVMHDELTVSSSQLKATLKKGIQYLDYANRINADKFFLPEFRVISKYNDMKTFGPTTCTTFFHFSLDEFNKKDYGVMP